MFELAGAASGRLLGAAFVRLLGIGATLLAIVTLVFITVRAVPGDPVDHLLGDQATEADRATLRHRMHLDGTLPQQYLAMLGDLTDGTLGTSHAVGGRDTHVATLVADRLPHTIALAFAALLAAVLMALPLGIGAALQRDRLVDHAARTWALLAVSMPAFVSGPLALFAFAVWLPWAPTPADAAGPVAGLVLPAIVLGFALSGRLSRLLRGSMIEALSSDFVLAARARGLPEARILFCHALANAALPVITVLGLQLAALLSGALVTEKVFGRPGLGTLLLEGIASRDYPVVQGCVLVIGATYVVIDALVDALVRWLDPRLRPGARVAT